MSEKRLVDARPTAGVVPRIILHGGAGNITRTSVPRDLYDKYRASLLRIVDLAAKQLAEPGATALDVATYAVSLLEDDPLYNSAHGAVFTREGKNELECSIMVSNGYKKRGIGCMLLRHVKNPIKLAREFLVRGEELDGGGAGHHCQYSGEFAEKLAHKWGLDIVDSHYFFTQRRWQEHLRGLEEEKRRNQAGAQAHQTSDFDKKNYIPLGTCGAVVVDSYGTVCTATSTGGLTNKVAGRIGDTPTLGAGFWAEEWYEEEASVAQRPCRPIAAAETLMDRLSRGDLYSVLGNCLAMMSSPSSKLKQTASSQVHQDASRLARHAVGLSGTGNGDSFLRTSAARTTAAKARFCSQSLCSATTWMAGRGGELQKSAGDRWDGVHEGVGGIIGIEVMGNKVDVVQDYNGGGMFRAWTEENGCRKCCIFRHDSWESGPLDWQDV